MNIRYQLHFGVSEVIIYEYLTHISSHVRSSQAYESCIVISEAVVSPLVRVKWG